MTPEHENHVLQHRHLSKAGLRGPRVLVGLHSLTSRSDDDAAISVPESLLV